MLTCITVPATATVLSAAMSITVAWSPSVSFHFSVTFGRTILYPNLCSESHYNLLRCCDPVTQIA